MAGAVLTVIVLIGAVALAWHPWRQRPPTTSAPSTPVESPPAPPTSTAAPVPPPPVAAPTSAAPAPTQVITAVAVVNGQPADGYHEAPSRGDFNDVFECDASPAAVDSGIYLCPPWAARAVVCWPSTSATLLCGDDPWDKELHRFSHRDPLPAVKPKVAPMPFALLLDDGTQCRIRIGGAEAGRDDGLVSAYWCHGESSVLATPRRWAAGLWMPSSTVRHPLWTVKVGPVRMGNLPPPQTHTVTTAWFAGN